MPKKKLTAEVAQELAELIEDRAISTLTIRPRLSGKNKGELFAEWRIPSPDTKDTVPEHLNLLLVEALEDIAKRLTEGKTISIQVNKTPETQFISYTRSE